MAILLLAWAATERSDLVIERTPEEIDVSLNGVRLTASLAGIESPLNRVSVELSAVDERPVAAPVDVRDAALARGVRGLAGGRDARRR